MIGLSEICGSRFRCEDLILLHFYLQVLNNKMLKPNNKICLKCESTEPEKYKQRKNVVTDKKCIQKFMHNTSNSMYLDENVKSLQLRDQ